VKATPSRPLVVLAGVSLRLGDRLVFRDTHWTFARRQHWALVGANESGKTLFAQALAGEIPVAGGEIQYHFGLRDRRWQETPEAAVAQVSFEQQKIVAGNAPSAARWFSLEEEEAATVRQFLSQGNVEEVNPFEVVRRSRQSVKAFARRQRWVVHLLQIAPLLDRRLPSLSTGEMRKTLLARALLRRPQLLILDDPFTGLDATFRAHLKRILEVLMRHRSLHLLLIATHPDELPRGITHMLCVDHCRVVAQGTRSRMLKHPQVRRLFGGTPGRVAVRRLPPAVVTRPTAGKATELVRLEQVTVRYGRRSILKEVDWAVRRGEHWALLGPNGAGKSTLLSLIIGDHPQAYANAVRVFGWQRGSGEDVWRLKRRIGCVSPELHLHFPESQSCLEAVVSGFHDTNGCFHRITPHQRDLARRWLSRLGLAGYAERTLGSLSAGLQRMALLARALVKAPDLLVLDEPCQGLDPAHRARFLRAVESLLRTKASTVIYVTHRPDEIPRGIARVLRLREGRVVRA
jgi:molybdate transport system ATP-binding protein